ncbi:MAG: substrate-binding domain-containing protein [Promethearchaeota archaeon]
MIKNINSGGITIKARPPRRQKRPWTLILIIFLIGLIIGSVLGYFYGLVVSQVGGETVRLEMVYGSEKRGWIEEITPLFEEWWKEEHPNVTLDIFFRPLGSRESMISLITGGIRPTIWSPASTVWIPLANLMWAEEQGSSETLVTEWETFVYSPIVIGTWENYAKIKGITGFQSLHELAVRPDSDLKYAHTNPQLSNSGFMGVILETAVAASKNPAELSLDDLKRADVKKWMTELEAKAVYYGESTGFLIDQASEGGPSSLNAFLVYENLIIEKNLAGDPKAIWNQNLKAIYPEEGTLLSDHPFCILNAPWVSEMQKWAAQEFFRFLNFEEILELALKHGFRLFSTSKVPTDIFNSHNGVESTLIVPIHSPPQAEVLNRIIDLWEVTKAKGT